MGIRKWTTLSDSDSDGNEAPQRRRPQTLAREDSSDVDIAGAAFQRSDSADNVPAALPAPGRTVVSLDGDVVDEAERSRMRRAKSPDGDERSVASILSSVSGAQPAQARQVSCDSEKATRNLKGHSPFARDEAVAESDAPQAEQPRLDDGSVPGDSDNQDVILDTGPSPRSQARDDEQLDAEEATVGHVSPEPVGQQAFEPAEEWRETADAGASRGGAGSGWTKPRPTSQGLRQEEIFIADRGASRRQSSPREAALLCGNGRSERCLPEPQVYGIPGIVENGSDAGHSSASARDDAKRPRNAQRRCLWIGKFPYCNSRAPTLFAFLSIFGAFAFVGACFRGMTLSTDFNAFLKADGEASRFEEAFLEAWHQRGFDDNDHGVVVNTSSPRTGRRLQGAAANPLQIFYRAKDAGTDLIDMRILGSIREFEQRLRSLPGWKKVCVEEGTETYMCEPGYSMVNFVWPQLSRGAQSTARKSYIANANGEEEIPLNVALDLVSAASLQVGLFPQGYQSGTRVNQMRTYFEFRTLVGATAYKNFLFNEAIPVIREFAKNSGAFDVYWDGKYVTDHAVFSALIGDALMASGSGIFIVVYLAVHTRSILVSCVSLGLIALSMPIAFVVLSTCSGSNTLHASAILALFLIIGLGADVVLVLVTFWDASLHKHQAREFHERIVYMYRHAAFACLATTLTTAASFFANLTSVLRQLREFGFFMGACIVAAYGFLVVGLPPALTARERLKGKCLCCCCCCRPRRRLSQGDQEDMGPTASSAELFGRFHRRLLDRLPSSDRLVTIYVERFLVPCRWPLVIGFTLVPILLSVWTAKQFHLATAMQVWPAGSNAQEVQKVKSAFDASFGVPLAQVMFSACYIEETYTTYTQRTCAVNRCDLSVKTTDIEILGDNGTRVNATAATCQCLPSFAPGAVCEPTLLPQLKTRFVGLKSISQSLWGSETWKSHAVKAVQLANRGRTPLNIDEERVQTQSYATDALATLVQQHWETGFVASMPFLSAPSTVVPLIDNNNDTFAKTYCHAFEVCYCGAPECKFFDQDLLGPNRPSSERVSLQVPVPSGVQQRRLSNHGGFFEEDWAAGGQGMEVPFGEGVSLSPRTPPRAGRRLVGDGSGSSVHPQAGVPARRLGGTSRLNLVWGLSVNMDTPILGTLKGDLWAFNPNFHPESPSVQRHFIAACDIEMKPAMRVRSAFCWVQQFRDWLKSKGLMFPVRPTEFHGLVYTYAKQGTLKDLYIAPWEMMWFGPTGQLVGTFLAYDLQLTAYSSGQSILEAKSAWSDFVSTLNQAAPANGDGAWHSAGVWVSAEAKEAILSSTAASLGVSVGCGLLGSLASMGGDMRLSLLVVAAVLGVTMMLLWFVTVVMGWGIGPIEVLGLIIFVGYSITYALHVAHKYREHMADIRGCNVSVALRRRQATSMALKDITGAIFGSALTTVGSTSFLFGCTIVIFVRVAWLLFTVTVLSVVFALTVMPAAMLVMGPVGSCLSCCQGLLTPEPVHHHAVNDAEAKEPEPSPGCASKDTYISTVNSPRGRSVRTWATASPAVPTPPCSPANYAGGHFTWPTTMSAFSPFPESSGSSDEAASQAGFAPVAGTSTLPSGSPTNPSSRAWMVADDTTSSSAASCAGLSIATSGHRISAPLRLAGVRIGAAPSASETGWEPSIAVL